MKTLVAAFAVLLSCTKTSDEDALAKRFGEQCTFAKSCGDLAQINCRPEVDGPIHYVRKSDGKLIQTCAEGTPRDQPCPPLEWTCPR